MITYQESGVDITLGDSASNIAFNYAKSTFEKRKGMIGEAFCEDGSFAGLLDFGYFFIAQCCDTVGTKIDLAEKVNNFAGLGSDLLAMVADDAVCIGAETVSITNTTLVQPCRLNHLFNPNMHPGIIRKDCEKCRDLP